MTIREATAQGAARLKSGGIETPSLDASLLLARVLDTSKEALAARGTEELSQEALAALCAFIDRRINGECIAYITGKKEFFALEFSVNPHVLVPRPDTEILVEAALEVIKKKKFTTELYGVNTEFHGVKNGEQRTDGKEQLVENRDTYSIRALDLCTGSGAITIALKNEIPSLEVYATDISAEALEAAKTNAQRLLPANSIHFYSGDLYSALPHSLFSLIVSNPPYIPTEKIKTLSAEVQNEPRLALDGGKDGLEIIRRIIDGAPENLKQGGILLLEAAPYQMKEITHLLEKRGFKDIKLYKDLSGQDRVIGGRYEG